MTSQNPTGDDRRPGVDRRRALLGMGAGAAAAWAAPAILSQTAAAAASAVCPACGSTLLVNGGAESGAVSPWVASGPHPFSVSTWASLPNITPVAGSGTYAFAASNGSDSFVEGYLDQDVAIDPTCADLPFDLSGDLGGLAPTDRIDLAISVDFFDGSSNPLGDGGASPLTKVVMDQQFDSMTAQSSSGTVPVGAETAVVTVSWIGEGAGPLVATAAADNVALVIACM